MESESPETALCKNCDTPLPGGYCPKCGQRDYDFNRSFREIAAELAESFWNFDTKILRGVFDLLFRPGFLTVEFLAGRRARQVPPLRFYLFVSILFFLTKTPMVPNEIMNLDEPRQEIRLEGIPLDPATMQRVKEAAAARRETPDPSAEWITNFFRDRYDRRDEIARMIGEHLPKLIFACLPVFALITRVVFRKSRRGYLSHLVMAMHLHSFYFLFTIVSSGWVLLLGLISEGLAGIGTAAGIIYLLAYLFIAARKVFGFSRFGTFWRAALTAGFYTFALGVGFILFILTVVILA